MHFYYLDEAGCTGCDLSNTEQPIFVLGGISVRDEGWNETQKSLNLIVKEYFDNSVPENFELHAEQLLSPDGAGPFLGHDRNRRNSLAKGILGLLSDRSHDIHLCAIDKARMRSETCTVDMPYDTKTPYLVAFDYLITHINWFVKKRLGRSARGMLIIDAKEQYHDDIERITRNRRFEGSVSNRVKWIVEFSYPVDSQKNPMIQLSDLVVFCGKKFLELDGGYRDRYSPEAKQFFAECYSLIHARIRKKTIVDRQERNMEAFNSFLNVVKAKPVRQWKRRYGL